MQQHGAVISAAVIDEACQDIPVDEAIRDIAQSVRSMDGVETFAELGSVPAEVEKHTACKHCNGDTNTIKRGANGVSRWLYCKQCTRTVFLRCRSDSGGLEFAGSQESQNFKQMRASVWEAVFDSGFIDPDSVIDP